jgi:glycosyltransferase involved in cell wall biosynthesis
MFDQLVVGAAPGDAITRNALVIREALSALGPSELYANFIEPGVDHIVRPLAELARRPNRPRPLVFHASIGCWPVFRELQALEPRLALVYHNFSPAEPFARFAPDVADDLIRGRWELARLRDRVELAVADSAYNAAELDELGYTDVRVVAPTPDVDRLDRVVPDPAMLRRLTDWGPGPVVLCVAQLLPHKRIERVLAAVAVLQQEYLPSARLALVGVERFADYSRALRSFARSVGLADLQPLGRVTDEELAALYLRAGAFCTLSEHEGFCVPAVEAMALGVPVVASARAAIPDTVRDAGVLVDDPDDPVLVAGVLHRVLTDPTTRHVMVGRGVARARELSADRSLPQVVDALLELAGPVVQAGAT